MPKLLRNEAGQVEVALPFLIFLLFLGMVWGVRVVQVVTLADVNLKESVAISVRAAAGQGLGSKSLYIEPEAARKAFEEVLAMNLGLDPVTLEARENSAWRGKPDYTLWVWNRDGGMEFRFEGGLLLRREIKPEGTLSVVLGGGITAGVSAPGVVAKVALISKGILGSPQRCERWAAAGIEVVDGQPAIVLHGAKP